MNHSQKYRELISEQRILAGNERLRNMFYLAIVLTLIGTSPLLLLLCHSEVWKIILAFGLIIPLIVLFCLALLFMFDIPCRTVLTKSLKIFNRARYDSEVFADGSFEGEKDTYAQQILDTGRYRKKGWSSGGESSMYPYIIPMVKYQFQDLFGKIRTVHFTKKKDPITKWGEVEGDIEFRVSVNWRGEVSYDST